MNHSLRLIGFAILLVMLALVMIRPILFQLWFQRRILNLLGRDEITGSNLVEICGRIAAINASSQKYTFEITRAGNFQFREQRLTLIWGSIGSQGWPSSRSSGWGTNDCFYVLANAEQAEWMKDHPDVFSPLFLGAPFSLFEVKMSAHGLLAK